MIPDFGKGLPQGELATSYEVRWFMEGELPDAVVRLMGARGDAWPPGRTDRYLSFAADMGIKLRAEPHRPALLEFKGRQRLDGPVSLAPGVAGVSSTWTKWSYGAELVPAALLQTYAPNGPTIPVEKTRLLRRFSLDPGAPAREVALPERLTRGVQLELTRVRVPQAPGASDMVSAWTVGLEAFPVSPGLEAAAQGALADPLEALANAGAALDLGHSASYPEWLLARCGPGGRSAG